MAFDPKANTVTTAGGQKVGGWVLFREKTGIVWIGGGHTH